ncbi:MAG: peptide deformylase [Flavobacteriales bacterium]|nr:peptide deformylase [Flavobacteriales bacterium]
MILPITAYGDPVLKKTSVDIDASYPELSTLIANMFETMEEADGVGLAAPQVGLDIRLVVIDASPMAEDENISKEEKAFLKTFKKTLINPQMLNEWGEPWAYEEGCLSLPGIHEKVFRPGNIRIKYMDENFVEHEEEITGLAARVVQHEYDHLEGLVFTDHLSPLTKRMLQKRLQGIGEGRVHVRYPMRFHRWKK